MKILSGLLLLFAAHPVLGAWTLDNVRSQVSFVSTKAQNVAEAHRFTELSGLVSDDGTATVTIQLASVDTLIEIRDQRMREMLFKTDLFPTATVVAQLDVNSLRVLAPGATLEITSELILYFQDSEVPVTANLLVARLSPDRILVTSLKPMIINAGSLQLEDGIEALRQIAGLPSISTAVPVSIVLTFTARP